MKATAKILITVCASLISFSSFADCLGAAYVRGNDPCSENNTGTKRLNSFGDHNVSNSRMTREQEITAQEILAPIRARKEQEAIRAQEIRIANEKERQRQENIHLRQQEIIARNRQADATEAAALAALAAARAAERAAIAAAQQPAAPPPDNRPFNCFRGVCTR